MLLAVFSFVFGLIVGSFLNVVIHRVPRRTFFGGGRRSHCPACGAAIAWYDNVPIVGWLRLKGRARCCGAKISGRYPFIEVLTGVAFALASLLREPATQAGLDPVQAGQLAVDFFLLAMMIACSAIDIEHRILPDVLNFFGVGIGFVVAFLLPSLHANGFVAKIATNLPPAPVAILDAFLGCLVGAGLLYAIAFAGKLAYKTEAMGLGDVKFMAFTGTFIGPDGVLLALLIACLLGAVVGVIATIKTGDPLIPFGPFLAAGVLVAHFARGQAFPWIFETWPRFLSESPWGKAVLGGITVLSLVALIWLRRRRRSA
ncbi:MAG: prepilin peptidase [Planctomycetes bacterium]|nr:prepilin peptidase [Planctomycetota bacterium]MCB9890708.1 prepilin peptidase [Planctomycetota bacterium]MCB9920069.1 prepilin peptidase [Planctomycetota bacterium]